MGAGGQFALDVATGSLWIGTPKKETQLELGAEAGRYDCDGPPNALVDLALGRGVNRSPGWLGARTVEILAAVYESAAKRSPVTIEPARAG